ncbi:MAG TPA: DUF4440 domain-containing protein [Candidatus Sulfotelmatobacter sp.]|nr:DUF4440 domain-containing protein [Candidatus Sulfotelmatobacter sp.]
MRRPKPSPDEMAAAMEAVQRLAAEAEGEESQSDFAEDLAAGDEAGVCGVCGYHNRGGNKFCAMCGVPLGGGNAAESAATHGKQAPKHLPEQFSSSSEKPHASRAAETHHYHHHYHHHYFPAGYEAGGGMRPAPEMSREAEKPRSSAIARDETLGRAEAGVRRATQEWVVGCNTKHLDDLLDLYTADALVLRSNYPPVRGAAAIREFFFGAIDSGLGEVEIDPIRLEVIGEMAYEAGRFKALVPSVAGKRREERGKYLWIFARQSNSEWKLVSDCWSSDLSLPTA